MMYRKRKLGYTNGVCGFVDTMVGEKIFGYILMFIYWV